MPVIDKISNHLLRLLKQWGLERVSLIEGTTLWLGWTGLTWLAFLISLLLIEVGESPDVSGRDGLIGGALIGIAQWLMLKPYVQNAYRWIIVSALSWGALAVLSSEVNMGAIGWVAPGSPHLLVRAVFGLLYGGYVGLILGLGQWWVMRRHVAQAWRWIPLMTGIWAVAIAFGWLFGGVLRAASHLFVSEVLGLIVAWGAIAALSGLGIVGMIHPIRPTQSVRPNQPDSP